MGKRYSRVTILETKKNNYNEKTVEGEKYLENYSSKIKAKAVVRASNSKLCFQIWSTKRFTDEKK